MEKYLRVTFGESQWDVPLSIIAENRAIYYANLDNPGKQKGQWEWDQTFKQEYYETMNDPKVATDWASGNMDWDDVHLFAVPATIKPMDYRAEWVNAEKTIVEK